MAHEDWVILYQIERTDNGSPAWGIYMYSENNPYTADSEEEAEQVASDLREAMGGFGYAVNTTLAKTDWSNTEKGKDYGSRS
jgi:hypothetical protein